MQHPTKSRNVRQLASTSPALLSPEDTKENEGTMPGFDQLADALQNDGFSSDPEPEKEKLTFRLGTAHLMKDITTTKRRKARESRSDMCSGKEVRRGLTRVDVATGVERCCTHSG